MACMQFADIYTTAMEKHQRIAVILFLAVATYAIYRDEMSALSLKKLAILAAFLLPIMFYKVVAYFSGFGFLEFFAKDFKSENHPGPYALFFWIVFLIACGFIVFEWSVY